MKKIISMVIVMVMAAGILTACGGGSDKQQPAAQTQTTAAQTQAEADNGGDTTEAAPAEETTAAQAGRYTFVYKGTNIDVKADAAPICAALGKEKSYTEEKSCAFDGMDKNYVYSSFVMTTYPDGEMDRVNSVTLMDDTVSTTDGISIGDSQEKVEEVYGTEPFNGVNAYIMSEGDAQLAIMVADGKVSSIMYTAKFE